MNSRCSIRISAAKRMRDAAEADARAAKGADTVSTDCLEEALLEREAV